ncbi:MAG: MarC family NAAT transporter [Porphyrobacter sp.]|nr:MarC family NAAT transporter [Porphyrobacter sp.]
MFPIVNPFSTAPLFVSLTGGMSDEQIRRQALKGCIYGFSILLVFLLLGARISDFFGISVPGIRVAGGLIIAAVGFRMLFPRPKMPGEVAVPPQSLEIAFAPIAMPSLAGPGSISVILAGATRIRSFPVEDLPAIYAGIAAGLAITFVIAFIVLRGASSLVTLLGHHGIDAMTRIFGFLLMCISMEFLLGGIAEFYGIAR